MRSEIERVVEGIRERYSEKLTLGDLADMARLSPFHMARIFRQETGLPPARFLATVRLEKAKKKLLSTDESVATISADVGYDSLGTFTTRFTKSVGVSPGRYRRLGLLSTVSGFTPAADDAPYAYGSIAGKVCRSDEMPDEEIFIGAFSESLGNDRPIRCFRLEGAAAPWRIDNVPVGTWFVEGTSRSGGEGDHSVVMGSVGPLWIGPGAEVEVELHLVAAAKVRLADNNRRPLAFALPEIFHS
ncbi:helix-turn-helix transcriptional regulator [Streptosporangium sp. NPDC048865]|uniref:helix-turn-helix transcriptional regulator n=1 Tax=Streptosporangium sp. NPDC048865 TaxID=3155766 RepID=UPI00342081C4